LPISVPEELDWDPWPEDLVKEVGDNYISTEGKFTLTGSYLQDREQFPGLWRCVFEWVAIRLYGREIVKNTIDTVSSDG
jgi:hypothetical protein